MEKDTEDDSQMHDNDVEDEVAHRMIVKCMQARGRIRFH